MEVCRTIAGYRAVLAGYRAAGESIGLVTTMGALHPGHLALVAAAKAGNDRAAATIFVNPTQFGEAADLDAYPRSEAADIEMFRDAGVDAVLLPSVEAIYPPGEETIVETTRLANVLHGAVRPGHFRGVATVVAKLFNIAQPTRAYFGEKDYQQLAVIRAMVRDLHVPIEIVGVPTVREADGLAMSSRNARLSPEDRAAATVLSRALDAAEALARGGATAEDLRRAIADIVAAEPRGRLKGLDLVEPATFAPAAGPIADRLGIMLSVAFGPETDPILLIDQREITR